MPFISKPSRWNHHLCVSHTLGVIGWAIKTSEEQGKCLLQWLPREQFSLNQESTESKHCVWVQIVPFCKISPSSVVCPNDAYTAGVKLISSWSRTGKLVQKHANYLSGSSSCQFCLHLTIPEGAKGRSSRAGPLTLNCWAVESGSIWLDWGFSHPSTQECN